MNVSEYLVTLGFTDDDHVGLFWIDHGVKYAVVTPDMVPVFLEHQIPTSANTYIAPNPVRGPIRVNDGGRGTEEDVTAVRCLYADLDVKPGACVDKDAAQQIIDDIAAALSEQPMAIVHSGGGLQPIWCVEDIDPANQTTRDVDPATGRKLLHRFGRLVRALADARGIKVDSVFDTARVLRAPGTLNHKYDPPVEASWVAGDGAPMDLATVCERLDEMGIYELPDDEGLGDTVVKHPDDCGWALTTCGYMKSVVKEWVTEPVQDRHPWLLCQFVRLECAHRNGCMTKLDYDHGVKVLSDRFTRLCARPGDTRTVKRHEVRDVANEARERAARKTADQLSRELGSHIHLTETNGHSVPPPSPAPVELSEEISAPGMPDIAKLEDGFWQSRESLTTIYNAALSRMCAPWAVLACCAARALTFVRPSATLPALIGGPGSLNWFVAIAAPSGGGKGSSLSVARELVNVYVHQRNLGSGEGLVTSFKGEVTDDNPDGKRESVMFVADEIDNVNALGSRSGSTLLGTLRSAFSGETLGFAYATRGRDLHLDAHTYRMTFICSVQPGRAATLLGDKAGGTPQRFMWFPGTDLRINRRNADGWSPFGLTLPSQSYYQYPRTLHLPQEATDFILDSRERQARGLEDPLDGHATFAREKLAYALAVLDGRTEILSSDWELSAIAADVSNATRDWVAREMKTVEREEAIERGTRQGISFAAADDERADYAAKRSDRIAGWIIAKIKEAGPDGLSNRVLTQSCSSRDRSYLSGILAAMVEQGDLVGNAGSQGGMTWKTP